MRRSSIYVVPVHLFHRQEALLQTSFRFHRTDIFVWWYIVHACFVMSALAVLTYWSTPSEQIRLPLSLHSITTCKFPETLWFLCAFHLHLHSSLLNLSRHCRVVGRSFSRKKEVAWCKTVSASVRRAIKQVYDEWCCFPVVACEMCWSCLCTVLTEDVLIFEFVLVRCDDKQRAEQEASLDRSAHCGAWRCLWALHLADAYT